MPPPTLPIQEQILADIEGALLLCDGSPDGTGASGSSYFYELLENNIRRADVAQTDLQAGPYPLVCIGQIETEPETGSASGADTYWHETMRFRCIGVVGDQTDVHVRLRRLEADIRTALWEDPYRSGLATVTLWEGTEVVYPTNNADKALVSVRFRVLYEVKLSDLTSTIP